MGDWKLQSDGFCLLNRAVSIETVERLLHVCRDAFDGDSEGVRARSSRRHVYATRNLIESIPEVSTIWRCESPMTFLGDQLGDQFGLVSVLFFDKPPDRTWALPWHKDTAIAVQDNTLSSTHFSRPTTKTGVPHVIACDELLARMLTLRVHLDEVTDENGPLRVIPGSHVSSVSDGLGVDAAVTIQYDEKHSCVLVQREMECRLIFHIPNWEMKMGVSDSQRSQSSDLSHSCQNRREGQRQPLIDAAFGFGPDSALGSLPSVALSAGQPQPIVLVS